MGGGVVTARHPAWLRQQLVCCQEAIQNAQVPLSQSKPLKHLQKKKLEETKRDVDSYTPPHGVDSAPLHKRVNAMTTLRGEQLHPTKRG